MKPIRFGAPTVNPRYLRRSSGGSLGVLGATGMWRARMLLTWKSLRCTQVRLLGLVALVLLLLLSYSELIIYELNDGVFINRHTCPLRAVPLREVYAKYDRELDAYTASHPSLSLEGGAAAAQGGKVGLLMIYDKRSNYERIIRNRREYCRRQGCELIDASGQVDSSRPIAWSKLDAIRRALEGGFGTVFYLDMDAVIFDMGRKVWVDYVELFRGGGATARSVGSADIIMTSDWGGPNSGVMIVSNTDWSKRFLEELSAQGPLLSAKRDSRGNKYPFEYEQRAFHSLLNSDVWQRRGLDVPASADFVGNRLHVSFVPQCAMNSYSMHLFDARGNRDSVQFVESDFLIHFAGKKGRKKVYLTNYYLNMVEKKYGH